MTKDVNIRMITKVFSNILLHVSINFKEFLMKLHQRAFSALLTLV